MIERLKHHKMAWWGGWVLLALYAVAVGANFLAPYGFDDESRDHSYCPPTRLHVHDENGWHARPFVYAQVASFDANYQRMYTEDKSKRFDVHLFVKGQPYRFLGLAPLRTRLFAVESPGRVYLFGADARGRDLFSRILYGSRVSLSIGLVGAAITLALGLLVGGIAGYFGGKTDTLLMRLCEMFMLLPSFYMMLALRAAFPPELSSVKVYLLIVLIFSFIGWAGLARVVRGMVLSLRRKEFVLAAQAIGRPHGEIILRHILPNTMSYAIVAMTLAIPSYILGESALSLIGLGIQDPYASWGNLLSEAMNIPQIRYHPWSLIPGLFIFLAVMAFNFFGDGLRDALDPKWRAP